MAAIDAVPQLLRGVWERSLPLMRERLDHLGQTAAQNLAGTLSPDDFELAHSNAHKLAGSLGIFGFPTGSAVGRSIELLFEAGTPLDSPLLTQYTDELRSILDIH